LFIFIILFVFAANLRFILETTIIKVGSFLVHFEKKHKDGTDGTDFSCADE